MKDLRSIIPLVLSAMFICIWQSDAAAASFEEIPVLHRIIYVVIGIAAVVGMIAIFNNKLLTRILGRLGHSSGAERGPEPGKGAVIHHSSGEADFGRSADKAPPVKDSERDLPYPPHKSAD